jgi:hypothetical protein
MAMNRTLAKGLKIIVGLVVSFILAFQLEQITGLRTPGVLVTGLIFHAIGGSLSNVGYAFAMLTIIDPLLMFGIVCGIVVFASRFDARRRAG